MFGIFRWKNEKSYYEKQLAELQELLEQKYRELENQQNQLIHYQEFELKSNQLLEDERRRVSTLEEEMLEMHTENGTLERLREDLKELVKIKEESLVELTSLQQTKEKVLQGLENLENIQFQERDAIKLLGRVKQELKEVTRNLEQHQELGQEALEQLEQAKLEQTQVKANIEDLQRCENKLLGQLDIAKKDLLGIQKIADDSLASYEELKRLAIEELGQQEQALAEKNKLEVQLANIVKQLEEEIKQKQIDLEQYEFKYKQLHKDYEIEGEVCRKLQEKNRTLEEEYDTVQKKLEQAKYKYYEIKKETEAYERQIVTYVEALSEYEQKKKKVEQYIEGQNRIIKSYEGEIKNLKQERISLLQEVKGLEEKSQKIITSEKTTEGSLVEHLEEPLEAVVTEVLEEPIKVIFNLNCEKKSLSTIEVELEEALKKVKLVGEITVDYENYELLAKLLTEDTETNGLNTIRIRYPDSLVVFMVFTGIHCYDGQYWEYIENYLHNCEREKLMEVFHQVLEKYQLDTFESEEKTFKNVTAILFQAMIPNFSIRSIIQLIEEELNCQNNILDGLYEIKDTFSYRLDKPVQRYIDYLKDGWETLFVEIQEVLEGSQKDHYLTLSRQMIQAIKAYTSRERAENIATRGRISTPKLTIDVEGIGLYFDLPEQKFYQADIHEVTWCIQYRENKDKKIEADLHYKENYYFTKAIKLPIALEEQITVQIKINNEVIKSWLFKDLTDDYLAFNQLGKWEGHHSLTSKSQILLLNKQHELMDLQIIREELEDVPGLENYKVYNIALEEKTYIQYNDIFKKTHNIFIQKVSRPDFKGGKQLFGDFVAEGEKIKTYTELPDIYIYEIIPKEQLHTVKIIVKRQVVSQQMEYALDQLSNYIVRGTHHTRIRLQNTQLIPQEAYGHYEIAIYRGRRVVGKFGFEYTPYVEVIPHANK